MHLLWRGRARLVRFLALKGHRKIVDVGLSIYAVDVTRDRAGDVGGMFGAVQRDQATLYTCLIRMRATVPYIMASVPNDRTQNDAPSLHQGRH